MKRYIKSGGDESVRQIFKAMKPKKKKKLSRTPDKSIQDLSQTFITAAEDPTTKKRSSYFNIIMEE